MGGISVTVTASPSPICAWWLFSENAYFSGEVISLQKRVLSVWRWALLESSWLPCGLGLAVRGN